MSKVTKIISLSTFSILFCFFTYKSCYFIAEKFFFDKFFYQKSLNYGYWIPGKILFYSDFGDRAKDLIALENLEPDHKHNISKPTDNNTFKITIIGDSYVWGQGIKNNQRFAVILENKLNQIRPTKIYSLGDCGDNIFDDYEKYQLATTSAEKANLYIFGLVSNDLVFNPDARYHTNDNLSNVISQCNFPAAFYPANSSNFNHQLFQALTLSISPQSQNYCAFQKIVPLFPTNSLFVDLESLISYSNFQKQFSSTISDKLNAIYPKPKFSLPSNQALHVSLKEYHPSVLANQIYADSLFDEITTNPKWGFVK